MNIMNNFRQTGRTTRMLRAASKKASETKDIVYVIFGRQNEIDALKFRSDIRPLPNLVYITYEKCKDKLDPIKLKLHDCKEENTFIDHAVIEVIFAKHVLYLHKYDQTLRLAELDFRTMMEQGT